MLLRAMSVTVSGISMVVDLQRMPKMLHTHVFSSSSYSCYCIWRRGAVGGTSEASFSAGSRIHTSVDQVRLKFIIQSGTGSQSWWCCGTLRWSESELISAVGRVFFGSM